MHYYDGPYCQYPPKHKRIFQNYVIFWYAKIYIYESMANLIRPLKPRHNKLKNLRIEILSQVCHEFQF
jgi:hypothetical protein